jgi:conjugative relaxase-like TrwC/TraI family protein
VRDAVRAAHEAAVAEALALVEEHAAFTRTGSGGVAQIETSGLVAAAFEHWDSGAGDPNIHTHVAVSSKVQGTDGEMAGTGCPPAVRDESGRLRGLQHRV